jgi:hypothetical protein
LNDIWLRENNIATLPDSFFELSNLDSVYIMGAGRSFGRVGANVSTQDGMWLELEGNRLPHLPNSMAAVFADGRLHALELANNMLTALPAWVTASQTNITSINICLK